jgi:hypothetical protein
MSKLNFLCESYVPSKLGVSWFVCAHGGRSGLVKDCSKAPRGLTELSIGLFAVMLAYIMKSRADILLCKLINGSVMRLSLSFKDLIVDVCV